MEGMPDGMDGVVLEVEAQEERAARPVSKLLERIISYCRQPR